MRNTLKIFKNETLSMSKEKFQNDLNKKKTTLWFPSGFDKKKKKEKAHLNLTAQCE